MALFENNGRTMQHYSKLDSACYPEFRNMYQGEDPGTREGRTSGVGGREVYLGEGGGVLYALCLEHQGQDPGMIEGCTSAVGGREVYLGEGGGCYTHFAWSTRARTPAASGAEAEVPVCLVVHVLFRSVVVWKNRNHHQSVKPEPAGVAPES